MWEVKHDNSHVILKFEDKQQQDVKTVVFGEWASGARGGGAGDCCKHRQFSSWIRHHTLGTWATLIRIKANK